MPPYLAGREEEQGEIRDLLDGLEAGGSTKSEFVLYGLRGNGKTVLMHWARREAHARKIGTMTFSADEITSPHWLAQHLTIGPRWLKSLRELSAWGLRVKLGDPQVGRITEALARRARRRGLVIAVDEAHTLAVGSGRALHNAIRLSRNRGTRVCQ